MEEIACRSEERSRERPQISSAAEMLTRVEIWDQKQIICREILLQGGDVQIVTSD